MRNRAVAKKIQKLFDRPNRLAYMTTTGGADAKATAAHLNFPRGLERFQTSLLSEGMPVDYFGRPPGGGTSE